MHDHQDVIAERDGVVARVLAGAEGVDDAIALLDAAEDHLEVPLVDEAERERLHALAAGQTERAAHWHSLLARRGPLAVGYAGALLPTGPGLLASGDVAVAREHGDASPVLSALLAGLEGLAWDHRAGRLTVWVRHARTEDVACATDEGFGVERRLGVLGRRLDVEVPRPDPGEHRLTVRAYDGDRDDEAVVAVLAAAYAGTPDGGWDLPRFRERRGWSWFDPADLLLAEDVDTGRVVGLHWLKRRDATTGEVYNLAVHPEAQGRQVGAVLLDAGLAHLVERGCRDVLLWVDLANERAVRLYTSAGFHTRWEDVALSRTLRGKVGSGG